MDFIKKHSYTLILVVLAIIITFVYVTFFTSDEEESTSLTTETGEGSLVMEDKNSANVVGKDLLVLLQKLNKVKINDDILEDDLFLGLKDYSRDIEDQEIGRSNPFSPIK